MLFGGKIPLLGQMAINDRGEYTAQAIDPAALIMSSIDLQWLGLPPMGKDYKNVSLRGEDLSWLIFLCLLHLFLLTVATCHAGWTEKTITIRL